MLCLNSFKQFKDRMERAKLYSKQMTTTTNATIRSLTHPSAPCRECYRDSINDYFTCLTCESSIAREEQCVHSLNANNFVFITEHFSNHHFRRKFVSGSYISMDPVELENQQQDNDLISDNDSVYSDNTMNIETTADIKHSTEQNQGAFFEQMPGQSKPVKCLTASELKKCHGSIIRELQFVYHPVKIMINAIMLSLNEMGITDGMSNGILDATSDNYSDEVILKSINNLIREHRNTFLPSKNNFTIEDNTNTNNLKNQEIILGNINKIDSCHTDIKP